MKKPQFTDLQPLIIKWAKDKEILKRGNPYAQLLKTDEEVTELLQALKTNNKKEIEDAIGDIAVTLIIYAEMKKYPLFPNTDGVMCESKGDVKNDPYDLKELLTELLKSEDYFPNEERELKYLLKTLFDTLNKIANAQNLYIWKCLETAYDVIKNRTGKMIDGQFVKDK